MQCCLKGILCFHLAPFNGPKFTTLSAVPSRTRATQRCGLDGLPDWGGMGSGGASVFIVCLRRGSPATTPTSSGRTATPRAGCGVFGTIFVSGQGLHESPPSVTFHEKRPTVFEFGDRAPGLDTRRCTGQRRGCMGGPKGQNFPSGTLRRS